jgi:hypothetical protein
MTEPRQERVLGAAADFANAPASLRGDIVPALSAVLGMALFAHLGSKGTRKALSPHVRALSDLFDALLLLDDGIVSPMLVPRSWGHRLPASERENFIKLCLAAGCSALERVGLRPDEARRKVAALAGDAMVRAPGGLSGRPIRVTTLRDWQKRFRGSVDFDRCVVGLTRRAHNSVDVIETMKSIIGLRPPGK